MTVATGFKRLGVGIAVVVAVAFVALAAASFLIPANTVRDAVKAEIRAATGLDPIMRGDISVSLFPYGKISFADVVLGDDKSGEPALIARRLTAQLKFLPLFAGRFEIADVSLERPRINVTLKPDGSSNWSALVATLARTLKPDATRAEKILSFSEMRITDGELIVRDPAHKVDETISDIRMSLAWPSISKSFGATGRFDWRGETVDGSFSVADLFAALSGTRSGFKVRLNAAPLKVAFDGYFSNKPTLKVEGTLAADSPSLREAVRWVGRNAMPGGGFDRFTLKADTNMVGGTVALTGVNVELDGNTAEGVLTLIADGVTTIQGTLAANKLDLTPYVSTVRLLTANEREWSRMPIALDGFDGFDVDLRLSAAQIVLANAQIGRTALTTNLRDGRLTLAIGEAQAFGGTVHGSIALAKSNTGAVLKSQLQFTNVNLNTCLDALFGLRRLEGTGDLAFAVEASGESVYDLTRSLDGTATLTAQKGALAGLNIEQVLRRLEQRPLAFPGDFRRGQTPFEKLTIALKIVKGTATVEKVALEGPAVRLALDGSASIPTRDLDLKGTATLVPAKTSDAPDFSLPFVVQGSWDDPLMRPDAQSLIRRSPSAAPLFDAVRDKTTREAVQSVIERLTGTSKPAAAPPPAQPAATAPAAAKPATPN